LLSSSPGEKSERFRIVDHYLIEELSHCLHAWFFSPLSTTKLLPVWDIQGFVVFVGPNRLAKLLMVLLRQNAIIETTTSPLSVNSFAGPYDRSHFWRSVNWFNHSWLS
jgi:hypothetical protein